MVCLSKIPIPTKTGAMFVREKLATTALVREVEQAVVPEVVAPLATPAWGPQVVSVGLVLA